MSNISLLISTYDKANSPKKQFHFILNTGIDAKDYSGLAKKDHLKPVEVQIRRTEDMLNDVYNALLEWVSREQAHRSINETTNDTVKFWSIFTLILIVILGLYQTYSLKSFLKTKKVID